MPSRRLLIANRHPRLRIDRRAIEKIVETLDANALKFRGGCPPGELSLVFLTDAALAQLHASFLNDSSETDVITFEGQSAADGVDETLVAGEICVSADAAKRQSKRSGSKRRTRGEDSEFSKELTLYLIHGWLHLAGYDDLQPDKKRVMRRAEARALRILRAEGKIPDFRLRRAN